MKEKDEKKITVIIPEEIHKPARVKIAELDSSFQKVMLSLLQEWAVGKRTVDLTEAESEPDQRFREELDLLRIILQEGTSNDREWIIGNLKNFVEAIRSRKPAQAIQPPRPAADHPHTRPSRKQAGG